MYRIIDVNTGVEIGVTETPRYIKKSKSGHNVQTERKDATGIAYKSDPYNLVGTSGIGAEVTILLKEFDGGDNVAATNENRSSIDELELALCDLDAELHGGV